MCTAVELISQGTIDDSTETGLARHLGISSRHLRRLFIEHLGVTPDQLARSRRAHFARRLLDDTDLRVADIAFASGFGSVRQLNRVVAAVFRSTPTELRARRRASDRLVADGGLALRLAVGPSYDFDLTLRELGAGAIPRVEHISATHYRRTIRHDTYPAFIEVSRLTANALLLVAHLPRLEGLLHVVHRIRRMLGLEPGVATLGAWSPSEARLRAACRTPRDRRTLARLVSDHGEPVTGLAPHLDRIFPTGAQLRDADLDRPDQLTRP